MSRFGRHTRNRDAGGGALATLALALLAGLAIGCSEGPTTAFQPPDPSFHHNSDHGGGPPGGGGGDDGGDDGGSTTTIDVQIVTSVSGAGLYPSSTTAVYPGESNSDGDVWADAPCESLAFLLDLTGQGLGEPFDSQVQEDCNAGGAAPRLTIQRLLTVTATTPTLLPNGHWEVDDGAGVGSTNLSEVHNYYFVENDTRYNVIWRGGLYAHVTDNGDGTRTYTVSTEPDLADDAELWYMPAKGKPRLEIVGPALAHMELQVTVSN